MERTHEQELEALKEKRKNNVVQGTIAVIVCAIVGLAKVGEVVARKALED